MNSACYLQRLLISSIIGWGVSAQAGIIAHYTFDEGSGTVAHDSVGSANGTFAGNAAFVGGGISGGAVSLNAATSDLINMGNVLNPVGDFSVSAWIKTTQTAFAYVAGKQTGGTSNGYLLLTNTANGYGAQNKGTFYASSSTISDAVSSKTINDNQWHLLTGVYHNGGTLNLYVDGVSDGSVTAPAYTGNVASFLIGGATSSTGVVSSTYTGLVDDVQVYNNALTPANAAFLFANPGQATPEPASLGAFAAMAVLGLSRARGRCRIV